MDGSSARRESVLSDLAAAHDAYMELLGNLEEGSKVYNFCAIYIFGMNIFKFSSEDKSSILRNCNCLIIKMLLIFMIKRAQ